MAMVKHTFGTGKLQNYTKNGKRMKESVYRRCGIRMNRVDWWQPVGTVWLNIGTKQNCSNKIFTRQIHLKLCLNGYWWLHGQHGQRLTFCSMNVEAKNSSSTEKEWKIYFYEVSPVWCFAVLQRWVENFLTTKKRSKKCLYVTMVMNDSNWLISDDSFLLSNEKTRLTLFFSMMLESIWILNADLV